MSSFADEMRQYDSEWAEAAAEPRRQGQMLPDGPHQAIIDEARVEQQKDGRWTWNIKFQNQKGSIRKFQNLDHEVGRDIAAKDAVILGYDGPLSELEKVCQTGFFLDLLCDIKVVRKPGDTRDFVDIYVNRCLGKAATPDDYKPASTTADPGSQGQPSYDDSDIPF